MFVKKLHFLGNVLNPNALECVSINIQEFRIK